MDLFQDEGLIRIKLPYMRSRFKPVGCADPASINIEKRKAKG